MDSRESNDGGQKITVTSAIEAAEYIAAQPLSSGAYLQAQALALVGIHEQLVSMNETLTRLADVTEGQ